MEFIKNNWDWISSNLWGAFGLVALCVGLGWTFASLYYKERIEILKEKNSGISPTKKNIMKYQYAQHGRYGKNILSNSTSTVKVGEPVSLRADIPDGKQLHVEIKGPKRVYLEDEEASWQCSVEHSINWSAQKYQNEKGGFQAFDAEDRIADKNLTFNRVGEVTLNVYEAESQNISWGRTFSVEQA